MMDEKQRLSHEEVCELALDVEQDELSRYEWDFLVSMYHITRKKGSITLTEGQTAVLEGIKGNDPSRSALARLIQIGKAKKFTRKPRTSQAATKTETDEENNSSD